MREILFKAKRIDNGEWVEGFYAKRHGVPCIYENADCPQSIYEINPDTLCQHTGILDKNCQKIWENDILDCKDRVTVVDWNTPCGTWDSFFVRYKGELCSNGIQVVEWKYRAEVIGNIFDNPELLKGGVE